MNRILLLFVIAGAIFMSPVIGIIASHYLSKG